MLNPHDRIRLQHMLDAAREALSFAHGRTRDDLDRNRMLTLAVIKDIEIIGEAAAQVSEITRESSRAIPFSSIVAMRNRLIHAYFDIDIDRVWDTLTDDLPTLIDALQVILNEDTPA